MNRLSANYTGLAKELRVITQLELFPWWNFPHAVLLDKCYLKPKMRGSEKVNTLHCLPKTSTTLSSRILNTDTCTQKNSICLFLHLITEENASRWYILPLYLWLPNNTKKIFVIVKTVKSPGRFCHKNSYSYLCSARLTVGWILFTA